MKEELDAQRREVEALKAEAAALRQQYTSPPPAAAAAVAQPPASVGPPAVAQGDEEGAAVYKERTRQMRERKERERLEQIRRNEAEYAARLASEESAASQRRREIEARAAMRAETKQRQEEGIAADISAAIARRRAACDKRSKHFAHIVAGLDGAGVGDVQGYHDMRYAAGHAYKGD